MKATPINAPDAPSASGRYSQAVQVTGHSTLLFISGQIPVGMDGGVPDSFAEQCRLAWAMWKRNFVARA